MTNAGVERVGIAVAFVAVCLSLASCAATPKVPPPRNRVALKEAFDSAATWIPSQTQTDKALLQVYGYLKTLQEQKSAARVPSDIDHILRFFAQYKVQFVGMGTDFLYCNFLRAPEKEVSGWKDNLITVFDGGPDFWHILCDTHSGECTWLMINGYA